MGHYASEMGADTPYDPYSEEAIEARRRDGEKYARLSQQITDSLKYVGTKWWKKESDDLS